MAGSMMHVGLGKLSLSRLSDMLTHPEYGCTVAERHVAPPDGLYLTRIHYPAEGWY